MKNILIKNIKEPPESFKFKISQTDLKFILNELKENFYLFRSLKSAFNSDYKLINKKRQIILLRNFKQVYLNQKIIETDFNSLNTSDWLIESKAFPFTKAFIQKFFKSNQFEELGKCLFALIPPKSGIEWHIDPFPIFSAFTRFHIPIISPKNSGFLENEKTSFEMKPLNIYAYDTKFMHKAYNKSNSDRVHLIVDCLVKRNAFSNKPHYLLEIYYIKKATLGKNLVLKNELFEKAFKKYGTGLIFILQAGNSKEITLHFLWNSLFSRNLFYNIFNVHSFLKKFQFEKKETLIYWKKTYPYYYNILQNNGKTLITRSDY